MPRPRRRAELTRRGWSLGGAACGLVVVSRLLGVIELMALGVVSLALIGLSVMWVRVRVVELGLDRSLGPGRVHAGAEGRIDLHITNLSSAPNPVLAVAERFGDGHRAARFLLPSLPRGTSARAAYRIPTARRGRFMLGPFVASVTDPFGLARHRLTIGSTDHVTVYPRLRDLAAPPLGGGGRRATTDAVRSHAITADGDEFTALREYEVGDDLRKVHWPATARTGDLFIRRDVAYREPRVVVLLDTREQVYDEAAFELAIELVASLLVRVTHDGRRLAILTTSGTPLCRAEDVAVGLDRLSVIEPATDPRPLSLAAETKSAALLIVVTGHLGPTDCPALVGDRRRSVIVVTTMPSDAPPPPIAWVDAARGDPAAAWNRALSTSRSEPAARRAAYAQTAPGPADPATGTIA